MTHEYFSSCNDCGGNALKCGCRYDARVYASADSTPSCKHCGLKIYSGTDCASQFCARRRAINSGSVTYGAVALSVTQASLVRALFDAQMTGEASKISEVRKTSEKTYAFTGKTPIAILDIMFERATTKKDKKLAAVLAECEKAGQNLYNAIKMRRA